MIKSFSCRKTEALFTDSAHSFEKNIARVAYRKLAMVDAAISLDDLKVPPNNRLEKLKGYKNPSRYSIRINNKWRVTFNWKDTDAFNVKIEDYHRG
tara:strand:+ start:5787 stop:6074 length:288 start_codon:yes stop_codon:yes gene_type:complete